MSKKYPDSSPSLLPCGACSCQVLALPTEVTWISQPCHRARACGAHSLHPSPTHYGAHGSWPPTSLQRVHQLRHPLAFVPSRQQRGYMVEREALRAPCSLWGWTGTYGGRSVFPKPWESAAEQSGLLAKSPQPSMWWKVTDWRGLKARCGPWGPGRRVAQ